MPEKSELVRRIFSDLEDDMMPPADSHLTLSDAEKALLRRWVAEGADYKPHWSLIPVHEVDGADPERRPRSTRSCARAWSRRA